MFTRNEFYQWCLDHGYTTIKGLEIHRVDNDGNYSFKNIELLTVAEHIEQHRDTVEKNLALGRHMNNPDALLEKPKDGIPI